MNENLELLAFVLMGEALLITGQARQDLLRHLWRCARALLTRLTKGHSS